MVFDTDFGEFVWYSDVVPYLVAGLFIYTEIINHILMRTGTVYSTVTYARFQDGDFTDLSPD